MRTAHIKPVSIANGEALSDEIDVRGYSAMIVICTSAAWTSAALGFKVSPASGGTFYPFFRDISGAYSRAEIASFAAETAYLVPVGLFPAGFVKLWSQNSGSDENQGDDRAFVVILKD